MISNIALLMVFLLDYASAQPPGAVSPLAQSCGPASSSVVCLNKYASVMPYHFYRQASNGTYEDTIGSTVVGNDSSWQLVSQADFLVFDQQRGLEVLGASPQYEFMFAVNDGAKTFNVDSTIADSGVHSCTRSPSLFSRHKQAIFFTAARNYKPTWLPTSISCKS